MTKRVVVDASLAVDLFVGRSPVRVSTAEKFFSLVQEGIIEAYAPRLFLAEVGVIVRFIPRTLAEEAVDRLSKNSGNSIGRHLLQGSREDSASNGISWSRCLLHRLSKRLNSPLVTNDRIEASNARKAGVKAFYLLEEMNDFNNYVKEQQR